MESFITKFRLDILQAGNQFEFPSNFSCENVVFCGMGGSGFAGLLLKDCFSTVFSVPFDVVQGYDIPAYVNENTLVIAASYSGNTEESLSCVDQALSKKAQILALCSGGKLLSIAKDKKLPHVVIEGGQPPRSALGFALGGLIHALVKLQLIPSDSINELAASSELLANEYDEIRSKGKELAKAVFQKTAIIYSEPRLSAVAIRGKQQFNENSKYLCWTNTIPEMNHNEIVGWSGAPDNIVVFMLHADGEHVKNSARMAYSESVFRGKNAEIHAINAKGASFMQQCLYLIHVLDWISFELGVLRGVDIVEVEVIEGLKKHLESIN